MINGCNLGTYASICLIRIEVEIFMHISSHDSFLRLRVTNLRGGSSSHHLQWVYRKYIIERGYGISAQMMSYI